MRELHVKAAAERNYRLRSTIAVCAVGALTAAGVFMMLYSFVRGQVLFGISYLLACVLGATYVYIRINTVYPVYLAADEYSLFLNTWDNGLFAYDVKNRIAILREFVPARIKLVEIPIGEIETVLIGTKNFIKRYEGDQHRFSRALAAVEKSGGFSKKSLGGMDIIYISAADGSGAFMNISNLDGRDVQSVIDFVCEKNPEIQKHMNSRRFKNLRTGRKN